jgi:hypothetical protein
MIITVYHHITIATQHFLHHCLLSHISHPESWLDPSQSLSAATPSRRRRSSDEEEGDDDSFSFMNETIVDEELIGTQFSLEQEKEQEKDEVLRASTKMP